MSNAHQTPSCVCGVGGGGELEVMSRLGIDRAINKEKGGGGGWGISGLLLVYLLDELHHSS